MIWKIWIGYYDTSRLYLMYSNDLNKWCLFLSKISAKKNDIYFTEEYINLYATSKEKPIFFSYSKGDKYFLFAYLLRSFILEGVFYYDLETPYGYGGPIFNTDDTGFITEALAAFYQYGKKNNYVAGFVRFHPLLDNSQCFETIGQVLNDRNTVAIDLRDDIESIWMNEIHTKNRNIIKKGEKNNLIFIADYNYDYIEEFIKLYNQTMDKLSADSFYYFTNQYYYSLKKTIKNSFLGVVLKDDKVISSAIFFYSSKYGHYHLSGSDKEALKLNPNNFMLWEAAKELKKLGVERFHLGGGTNADEHNSLLEFKRKFSKSLYSFQVGKIIFNHHAYDKLCADWEEKNPNKRDVFNHYLLKYKY